MTRVLAAGLVINIVVLVPVTLSLLVQADWVRGAYGDRAPARDILFAVYVAIMAASAVLLALMATSTDVAQAAGALLLVQVVYKVVSAATVRDLRNPVVVSNLFIAAFHAVSVGTAFT